MTDRKRRELKVYGRMEVGQIVRYAYNPLVSDMFTVADPLWVDVTMIVARLQESETGALVTLRHEAGLEIKRCFAYTGQEWGGFGAMHVVRNVPTQVALQLRTTPDFTSSDGSSPI